MASWADMDGRKAGLMLAAGGFDACAYYTVTVSYRIEYWVCETCRDGMGMGLKRFTLLWCHKTVQL